jgi:hypothetical protein
MGWGYVIWLAGWSIQDGSFTWLIAHSGSTGAGNSSGLSLWPGLLTIWCPKSKCPKNRPSEKEEVGLSFLSKVRLQHISITSNTFYWISSPRRNPDSREGIRKTNSQWRW